MPKVTFKKNRVLKEDVVVNADDGDTILETANANGVPVGSNCGGVCGCSTCHVYVKEGLDGLSDASDREEDILREPTLMKLIQLKTASAGGSLTSAPFTSRLAI